MAFTAAVEVAASALTSRAKPSRCAEVRRGSSPDAHHDAAHGCQNSAHLAERLQSIREELQPLLAEHDVEHAVREG